MLAAEKKAQLEASLQPQSCLPIGKVSSGEEQTGYKHWRRRSQSAVLRLDKARACDSVGKSVLDHMDKVCHAMGQEM